LIQILLYALKFEVFQFLAEIAKKEAEAKEQSQKLNISQNSNHKNASKSTSKSGDFLSRSLQVLALKSSDKTASLKKILDDFLQNGKKSRKLSIFGDSKNTEENSVTPLNPDNKVPVQRFYSDHTNPRIVIQESNSPNLSTRSVPKSSIIKAQVRTIEEGTDFGSVTSSEAEFTDHKEDHYLTQLHKIDDSSDEINYKSGNPMTSFNTNVEPSISKTESLDFKSQLIVSEPPQLSRSPKNDLIIKVC
jgi:hypothetical protein